MAQTLSEFMAGKVVGKFTPKPFYCPDGDFLTYYISPESSYAQRVDDVLTVYKSRETDKLVGCKVKGIKVILEDLENFGIKLSSESNFTLSVVFLSASKAGAYENMEYYEEFGRYTREIPANASLFATV